MYSDSMTNLPWCEVTTLGARILCQIKDAEIYPNTCKLRICGGRFILNRFMARQNTQSNISKVYAVFYLFYFF
jgi:hypothetical protein